MDFGFLFARVTSAGTASALDAGKGRLREAVEAVKGNRGAGALHVAAGRGRMAVCVYMVEELLTDVNACDDEGGFFCFFSLFSLPAPPRAREKSSYGHVSRPEVGGSVACNVKFAVMILQKHHISLVIDFIHHIYMYVMQWIGYLLP